MKTKSVAVVMGSASDWKVMKAAVQILKDFGIRVEKHIVSAHRTPGKLYKFSLSAADKHSLVIAGAGGAAHLPGMIASLTTIPVIGVPVSATSLKGLDSLLSIAQMPKGIPVATVAIDNSTNAGLLAVRILSLTDAPLRKKLTTYHRRQTRKVLGMKL